MIKLPPGLIYGILAYLSDSTHAVYYLNTSAMQLTAFILPVKELSEIGETQDLFYLLHCSAGFHKFINFAYAKIADQRTLCLKSPDTSRLQQTFPLNYT